MNKKASLEIILGIVTFFVLASAVLVVTNWSGLHTIIIGKATDVVSINETKSDITEAAVTSNPESADNVIIIENSPEAEAPVQAASLNIVSGSGGGRHSSGSSSRRIAEEAPSNIIDSSVNAQSFVSADSYVLGSVIIDSNIINSIIKYSFVDPSNIINSTVLYSNITDSNVTNSLINYSNLTNSVISNSNIQNSTVENSTIRDITITNLRIVNNRIISSSSSAYAGRLMGFTMIGNSADAFALSQNASILPAHTGSGSSCTGTNCNRIYLDNRIFLFNITNTTSVLGTMTLNGFVMASTAADKITFTGTAFLWGNATITSLDPSFNYSGDYKVIMEAWNSIGALAIIKQTGTSINNTQFVVNMTRILSTNEIIIQNTTQIFVNDINSNKQYDINATNWAGIRVYNAYETRVNVMLAPYIGLFNRTTTVGMINITNSTHYWVVNGWGKGWYNQNNSKYSRIFYGYVVDEGNISSPFTCTTDLQCDDSNPATTDVCFDKGTVNAVCLNGIANVNGTVYDENGNTVSGANISFYNASVFRPYDITMAYAENGTVENSTGNYSLLAPKILPDVITDVNGYYAIYLPNTTAWHMVLQSSKKVDFDIDPNVVKGKGHDTEVFENDSYDPYNEFNVEGHIIHSGQYLDDNNYTCGQKVEFVMFGMNKGSQNVTISFAVENHSMTGQPTHTRWACQNQTGIVYDADKIVYCGDPANSLENLFIPAGAMGQDKVEKHYVFDVPCLFAPDAGERMKYDIHVYDNLQWGNMHKIGNFFVYGFDRNALNNTNITVPEINQTNQTENQVVNTTANVEGLGTLRLNVPAFVLTYTNSSIDMWYHVIRDPAPNSIEALTSPIILFGEGIESLAWYYNGKDANFNVTVTDVTNNVTLLTDGNGSKYMHFSQWAETNREHLNLTFNQNGYKIIKTEAIYEKTNQTIVGYTVVKVAITEDEADALSDPVYRTYFNSYGGLLPYEWGDPWYDYTQTVATGGSFITNAWDRLDDPNSHVGDEYDGGVGDYLTEGQINATEEGVNTCDVYNIKAIPSSTGQEYVQILENFLRYLKCTCGNSLVQGGPVC